MITMQDKPKGEPRLGVINFNTGNTFEYNARYYLVVMISDEEEKVDRKTAVDLRTGEEIGKYKRSPPRLYPVDLEMRVVSD